MKTEQKQSSDGSGVVGARGQGEGSSEPVTYESGKGCLMMGAAIAVLIVLTAAVVVIFGQHAA